MNESYLGITISTQRLGTITQNSVMGLEELYKVAGTIVEQNAIEVAGRLGGRIALLLSAV
jgi:hypothetical protein